MKHCDLATGTGRIQRAAAKLKDRWQDTQAHWNDQARRDFEKNYLQPLAPQITLALAAIHELSEILKQAERDLEDEQREDAQRIS
jgi:uncharacterized protein YukE